MSLAFRTSSCSVNLEAKQDWSLQGRPGWSIGPSSLWDKNWERESETEQHHKWYHRWHVETLFKHWKRVFLQQSLRISRDDKEESQGKVTGRREINSGKPRLTSLAIYGSFNCLFPFYLMVICHISLGNWPLRKESAVENYDLSLTGKGSFHLSQKGVRVKVDKGPKRN